MDTNAVLIVLGIAAIYLMTRKWFWLVAFGIGALASAFATLASIVHFQILGALGFFFLAVICGFIASAIASSYD
mgnify:CR=1 FL=1